MLIVEILRIVVETIAALFASALLLRAWMQWVRLGVRNPIGGFVLALTNWLVLPLRRVIPATRSIDWASLIGALLVAMVALLVLQLAVALAIGGAGIVPNPLAILVGALFWVARWALYLVMLLTIVWAVLSWVNPHAPIAPALDVLLAPLLAPFRRVLPTAGGLDLSPIGLFVVIQIALLILNEVARGVPNIG